jgi:CRP/FNR family nitrogen fixation transcriptional regulator
MALEFATGEASAAHPRASLIEAFERSGVRTTFRRDEELYAQDTEADCLIRLLHGAARTTRLGPEGRRRISGFYYPGDILGLETGPRRIFSAEAVSDVEAQVVHRSVVRAFAGDLDMDRAILDATRLELKRAQSHMLILGLKNAREKVIAFLLSLSRAGSSQVFELAMSRQDMADYLGLTIETVSRMLGQLQDEALVEFPSARRFRVRRWDAFEALAA